MLGRAVTAHFPAAFPRECARRGSLCRRRGLPSPCPGVKAAARRIPPVSLGGRLGWLLDGEHLAAGQAERGAPSPRSW